MNLRPKRKDSIIKNLFRIQGATFDESHIKELLIDIRELVDKNSFTRELGDFVAHDGRTQGPCHQEFDYRMFFVMNSGAIQFGSQKPGFKEDILNLNKKVYELIINKGLEKTSEQLLKQTIGLGRKQTKAIFLHSYAFDKKLQSYKLTEMNNLPQIYLAIRCVLAQLAAMPFIRSSDVIKQLNKDIKLLSASHLGGINYNDWILKQGADITVCIFSLLQDVTFVLYNDAITSFSLSQESEYLSSILSSNGYNSRDNKGLMLWGAIHGMNPDGSVAGTYTTPFIESDVMLSKYYDVEWTDTQSKHLVNMYTERDSQGRLRIIEGPH